MNGDCISDPTVGVNHGPFQQLTQPFGFPLPSNEAEYLQMSIAVRRLGHIVESRRDNIASTLRSGGNRSGDSGHYWSNPGGEEEEEKESRSRSRSLTPGLKAKLKKAQRELKLLEEAAFQQRKKDRQERSRSFGKGSQEGQGQEEQRPQRA